jgi:hypothetical protein
VVIEVGGRIVKRGHRCSDGLGMQASVSYERVPSAARAALGLAVLIAQEQREQALVIRAAR